MRGREKVTRSQKYVATDIRETAEMLAALEPLPNIYEKNPCKWRGSCKHDIMSAKTLCFPAIWKALI